MKVFDKNGVLAAARTFGVTPNRLGAGMGYTDGPAADGVTEAEAKFLLCPFAVCHIAQKFPDETMFFTTALSRADGCAFCGIQENTVTLGETKPFDGAAAELLEAHLGGLEPKASGVDLPLYAAQAAVLLALSDSLRRRRLSCLLDGRAADLDFSIEDIQREINAAASENDPRWLLPFMNAAAIDPPLDEKTLPDALASLDKTVIVESVSGSGAISLTKNGARLIDALSRTDSFLAAASLFYSGDTQNLMVCLLLGGGGCEFYLELSEEGFLCTCDEAGALSALSVILSPGDVPDLSASDKKKDAREESAAVPAGGARHGKLDMCLRQCLHRQVLHEMRE